MFDISSDVLNGIFCGIAGGFIDNFGACIQKLSHKRNADQPGAYYLRPLWIMGISMYLFGTALNAVALSMAPQSILACLGPLTLIWNALNSVVMLKETVTFRIAVATLVIITGSGFGILTGSRKEIQSVFTIDDFRSNAYSIEFIVYFIFVIAVILFTFSTIRRYGKPQWTNDGIDIDHLGRRGAAVQRSFSRFLETHYLVVSYPILAGIFASLLGLVAKTSIALAHAAVKGYHSYHHVETYVLLAALPLLAVSGVHMLNMGMKRYDQLLVIPCYAVTLEIFNILGGGIFFRELLSFTALQGMCFSAAVLLNIVGVFLLSIAQRQVRSIQSQHIDMLDAVANVPARNLNIGT